ncbi:MAG TPA: hypothetical protein VGX03_08075 [Candidatus Binatia bacterium]|nr:hypothetical protein [Candidatus Binatia bacterium]
MVPARAPLSHRCPRGVQAACGEALVETRRAVAAEAQALHLTEQTVRAAQAERLSREAALRAALLTHRPRDYPRELVQRVDALRRTEVERKLEMLEWLRAQHEESRRHWEHGYQLLPAQLAAARVAFQAQTLSADDYCGVQERYRQALQMYRQGMQRYRTGMDLYAQALDAYGTRFLLLYTQGFAHPQPWAVLIQQLEQGDFLHDVLVPLTANAIRSPPPTVPPSRGQALAAESGR